MKANFSNLRKSSKIFEAKGKRLSSPNTVSTFIRCLFKEGGKKAKLGKRKRALDDACTIGVVGVEWLILARGKKGGEEGRKSVG